MTELFENENKLESNAAFTDCGKHRIWLYRIWDKNKPLIMFIGLNPSTANSITNDPTIRRVMSMAKSWNYGGVYMMNLFTFISTDPKKLNIKEGNIFAADMWLEAIGNKCDKVVFAWGNFNVLGRDKQVKEMFPDAFALHINMNGSPKHPLYVKSNTELIKYHDK
jgi:hypothetical protein